MGLNYKQNDRYRLAQEQEKAIFKVMSENGIGIYTDLMKTFYPMRKLTITIPILETAKIRQIFFDEAEEIKITVDFNKTVLKSETKTLSIENNNIHFTCPQGTGPVEKWSQETALQAANTFVQRLGFGAARFQLNDISQDGNQFQFIYHDKFDGYPIFSSYNKIVVGPDGILDFECAYYETENFIGEKLEICSPDEALLTLLKALQKEERKEGQRIDQIEIGYAFQEKSQISEGNVLKLIPCYRIAVSGREEPYLINAYTNKLIH